MGDRSLPCGTYRGELPPSTDRLRVRQDSRGQAAALRPEPSAPCNGALPHQAKTFHMPHARCGVRSPLARPAARRGEDMCDSAHAFVLPGDTRASRPAAHFCSLPVPTLVLAARGRMAAPGRPPARAERGHAIRSGVPRMTSWRPRAALLVVTALAVALVLLARSAATGAAAGTDWLTYGFDLARSGSNPNEATLTPSNVKNLTQIWAQDSFGQITGQPLYASGVTINGQSKDVVYAANGSGFVNAFDAATGALYWRNQFGVATTQCSFGTQSHGITGAPVIDRATSRIYFVDGQGKAYALNLSMGATVSGWPVTVITDPSIEMVWSALTLANGRLYVAVGSPCDNVGSRGRLVAINPSTAQITNTFIVVDPSHGDGGNIW